jgi:hypothetical protein
MDGLHWTQVALSLVIMLIGLYIAHFRHSGRGCWQRPAWAGPA